MVNKGEQMGATVMNRKGEHLLAATVSSRLSRNWQQDPEESSSPRRWSRSSCNRPRKAVQQVTN